MRSVLIINYSIARSSHQHRWCDTWSFTTWIIVMHWHTSLFCLLRVHTTHTVYRRILFGRCAWWRIHMGSMLLIFDRILLIWAIRNACMCMCMYFVHSMYNVLISICASYYIWWWRCSAMDVVFFFTARLFVPQAIQQKSIVIVSLAQLIWSYWI